MALSVALQHKAVVYYLPNVQQTEAVLERYLKNPLINFSVGSEPAMPAETSNQGTFQFPQQQFRSDIPEQNITMSGLPDMTGQAFPESAPVFPQYTPQSDYLTQTPGDDLAASEYISGYTLNWKVIMKRFEELPFPLDNDE